MVTVYVKRRDLITLGGVKARPETNVATNVSFEPLDASGTQTAAAPDFSMEGQEVDRVMRTMRGQGWDIGCLYNQETGEGPSSSSRTSSRPATRTSWRPRSARALTG